ncbi:hypothetical protein C8R45DRAFT_1090861 [Mycena sanguinolenta]|nr:hypothetical protein C8R45DRAFT_1090861 [Mycena sanguinolenta]
MDPNDRNFPRRKGPCQSTRCAGFFTTDIRTWEPTTLCECGAPWMSHTFLPDEVSSTPAQPPPQHPPHVPVAGSSTIAMDGFSPAEFFNQIKTHLDNQHISFPPRPPAVLNSNDIHSQPFILLKSSLSKGVYTLAPHPSINDNQFTHKELNKLSSKFPNPLAEQDGGTLPWVWIAPHYGNLIGPVQRFSTDAMRLSGHHPCFGLRVFDDLPRPASHRDDPLEIECYPNHCPGQDIAPILDALLTSSGTSSQRPVTPPSQQSLIRHRSPQSQVVSTARRVRPRQESIGHSPSPIEIDNPPLPPALPSQIDYSPPAAPRPEIIPLEVGVDLLDTSVIREWHNMLEPKIEHVTRNTSVVTIHGKTVEAVANCIIDLIVYFQKRSFPEEVFAMEDSDLHIQMIVSENANDLVFESFLNPIRCISIGVQDDRASRARAVTHGAGPERAALRHACTVLSGRHHYWQQVPGSSMFRPMLTPGVTDPERIKTFRAHGMFLALHCFILMQGPLPISLWLLCLIHGKEALLIPKNILLNMDPGAYDILAPWYDFGPDTPPNLIPNVRSLEVHNGWKISAAATILLGQPSPWDHPEYRALQEGFDSVLPGQRFANTLHQLPPLPFLVTIYDRRVHTVSEVSDHFYFSTVTRALDLTTPYFAALFRLRLVCYIHRIGHPVELRSQLPALGVSEQEFISTQNDPLLRANLVLRCGSDSDMRPTQDNWTINFRFQGLNTRNSSVAGPLGFHTCFYSIDVHLDHGLREILLEPVKADDQGASRFDLWLHEQLVKPDHNTR